MEQAPGSGANSSFAQYPSSNSAQNKISEGKKFLKVLVPDQQNQQTPSPPQPTPAPPSPQQPSTPRPNFNDFCKTLSRALWHSIFTLFQAINLIRISNLL